MRSVLRGLCILAAMAAAPVSVAAQDYPAKPVHLINASSAGGISDVFMRVVGEEFHKRTGQPMIIENRPGGHFSIGARACAEAAPDGYTICVLSDQALTYNHWLYKKLSYDPVNGLVPVTQLFILAQALTVSDKLGVKTLAELAALAKAKPKTLSYSAAAVALQVFMSNFNKEHGTDIVRVPFRGGGDAVNGVLSGTTPIIFLGIGNTMPYLRAGSMIGLAMDGAKRSPLFPNIPSLADIGYQGPLTRSYFALYAPAGTPKAILTKIADEVRSIASDPAFVDRHLTQRGLEPVFNTPDEFAAYLVKDREAAKRVVEAAGLKPQ
jgi:tripartite-type tricarboxylate transporter receptor subunit TctC